MVVLRRAGASGNLPRMRRTDDGARGPHLAPRARRSTHAATMVTTQTTTRTSALARTAPALCVVVALAIGAGAWMLPRDWFEPDVANLPERADLNAGAGADADWETPEAHAWTELIAHVERIREPDRVVNDDPPPAEDESENDAPEPERAPTVQRPPWGYEGYIIEPGGRVAVVRTNRGQRLVYEGETIILAGVGGEQTPYVVDEVGPTLLVLTSGDDRFEYELQETTARTSPRPSGGRFGGGDEPISPEPASEPVDGGGRDR